MDNGDVIVFKEKGLCLDLKKGFSLSKYRVGVYCEYFDTMVCMDKKRGVYTAPSIPDKKSVYKCKNLFYQMDKDAIERALIRGVSSPDSFLNTVSKTVWSVTGISADDAFLRVLFRRLIQSNEVLDDFTVKRIASDSSEMFFKRED